MLRQTAKYISSFLSPLLLYAFTGCATVNYSHHEKFLKKTKTTLESINQKEEFGRYAINDALDFNTKTGNLEVKVNQLRYEKVYNIKKTKSVDMYELSKDKIRVINYDDTGSKISKGSLIFGLGMGGLFLLLGAITASKADRPESFWGDRELNERDRKAATKLYITGGIIIGTSLIPTLIGGAMRSRGTERKVIRGTPYYEERYPKYDTEKNLLETRLLETKPAENVLLKLESNDLLLNGKNYLEINTNKEGNIIINVKPKNDDFVYSAKELEKAKIIKELREFGWNEKAGALINNARIRYLIQIKTNGNLENDDKTINIDGYLLPGL